MKSVKENSNTAGRVWGMWRDTYELVVNCCADTADLADCGGGSQGNGKRNHFFYLPDCVVSCGWASGNGAWQILQKRYCRRDCNSGFAVDSVHCAQAFKLGVFSAKLVAKLPVIRTADKLCGAVIGVLETILLLWTMYSLTIAFGLQTWWGELVQSCAAENSILRFFYKYNYLQHGVEFLAQKLKILGFIR